MSTSGSKSNEHVAHILVDIHSFAIRVQFLQLTFFAKDFQLVSIKLVYAQQFTLKKPALNRGNR